MIKFTIIGCGLIGQKRAKAIATLRADALLIACVDTNFDCAQQLASQFSNCIAFDNYNIMLEKTNPDAIIIATTHDALSEIGEKMIAAGKHVFLEKPAGRNCGDIKKLIKIAHHKNNIIHVGFNHRYHPAIQEAKKIIDKNVIGDLMIIRARYGHGGRLGYEKEWRANPVLSGGGELIDQGVHLIDLSRWFMGEFSDVDGFAHTHYWNMPVEDNAFLALKTVKKQVAFLHASCTEWKNLFSFEIFGKMGKLHINGLGGSYGPETLTHYKMLPEMGPPEIFHYEYPSPDQSWALEIQSFIDAINNHQTSSSHLENALAALSIVEKIYHQSGISYDK